MHFVLLKKALIYMQINPRSRLFLRLVPVLFSTLACNYVTQLVLPPTPTPTATIIPTQTATLTPLPHTPIPDFQAACPALLSDIMTAATTYDGPVLLTPRKRIEHEQEIEYLVSYTVNDDRLTNRSEVQVPDNFDQNLNDQATHEWIWNFFVALIPLSERDFITEFSAISDGQSNILGGVSRTYEDPDEWALRVDILDANDRHELTYTLMHELGHLLTLKSSQMTLDGSVFMDPDDQEAYQHGQAACPNYFSRDGCSLPESYLNEFFQRYWTSLFAEWQEIDQAKDDSAYEDNLHDFYNVYADQFLTEYAVTSPEEDIAESWAFFVLSPKPELTSIANEKILFFYEYPELLQLRQEILTRLCLEFPQ